MRRKNSLKPDATARELIAAARKFGALYQGQDGTIDGLLLFRGSVFLVDWKQPKGKRTPAQEKLSDQGWPIHYVADLEGLQRLLFGKTVKLLWECEPERL